MQLEDHIFHDDLSTDTSQFTAVGALGVMTSGDNINGNDVVDGIRGLNDNGGCAPPIFEGAITESNCSAILNGLGYAQSIV